MSNLFVFHIENTKYSTLCKNYYELQDREALKARGYSYYRQPANLSLQLRHKQTSASEKMFNIKVIDVSAQPNNSKI